MRTLGKTALGSAIRLDDPEIVKDKACHDERANWLATRTGLPAIGSKLVNRYGIEWVVQNHATVVTADSLQRWRNGDVQPENDLYPVVASQNFSPKLMEFFHAIDRCTTKTFAMLDTMPGRRKDGHVPGGNSIDTVSHPVTNLLFLDAARVHETVIAHEFGHAWVQYVDECEDLRTLEDASDPQRLRMVNFVQSFVLDLKVNDLIRRKGFDMDVIEGDQAASLDQLATALQKGYRPGNPREQVFMALLVADQMLQRDEGRQAELARFDSSLVSVRQLLAPVAELSEKMAEAVSRHGYDSHTSIISCIDECLTAAFDHCQEKFDLDGELVTVKPEEPDIDKFPKWIPILPPKLKCPVGRHMAKNDIPWEWAHSTGPTLTERTRVTFTSPEGARSEVIVPHRIGPPTPYFGMSEIQAECLEMKRQNVARATGKPEIPLSRFSSVAQIKEFIAENLHPRPLPMSPAGPTWPKQPGRPYMAGLGRFLTAVRLAEQMAGEHPYGYALANPTTYTDPSGLSPGGNLVNCIQAWVALGYSAQSACQRCEAAQGYHGCFDCSSQSNGGKPVPPWTGPSWPIIIGGITPQFPWGNLTDPGESLCEAACSDSKPPNLWAGPQVKWCKKMCQKIRQGGCNYLEDYCDTICSGGQENACKSCLAFWNASGCPGNIPTGGD